jgi:hypothetical protein
MMVKQLGLVCCLCHNLLIMGREVFRAKVPGDKVLYLHRNCVNGTQFKDEDLGRTTFLGAKLERVCLMDGMGLGWPPVLQERMQSSIIAKYVPVLRLLGHKKCSEAISLSSHVGDPTAPFGHFLVEQQKLNNHFLNDCSQICDMCKIILREANAAK